MMEKDDAVSTVIAMMLVLGIIVTLIAIYSATYLPGLKQQSEIEHSREVASAFARFDSDIQHVVWDKPNARFSEPFSLGGGDVLLSPVRSSGSLTITRAEEPLVSVTIDNGAQTVRNASLVNISYVPSFTAWESQGYRWEYGFVAVTKDGVAVPQSSRYNTRNEALNETIQRFVDLEPAGTDIEITVVNLTSRENEWFATGSGIATLGLNATVSKKSIGNVNAIVFEDLATPCLITLDPSITGMRDHLAKICNKAVSVGAVYVFDDLSQTHTLTFSTPVTVTLQTVNVEVSVC